jgi:hypothetical protein
MIAKRLRGATAQRCKGALNLLELRETQGYSL